jgi:hypothetical protein
MDHRTVALRGILATARQNQARIHDYLVQLVVLLIKSLARILESYHNQRPFHTSALSGLLSHLDCIKIALGVRKEVFLDLIVSMRRMGLSDSRHITLEEQLAIFLHACMTLRLLEK